MKKSFFDFLACAQSKSFLVAGKGKTNIILSLK